MIRRDLSKAIKPVVHSTAGRVLLLALVYALVAWLAHVLTFAPAYWATVWPAAGVAMAALLLGGLRLWPGAALGLVVFYVLTPGDASMFGHVTGIAAGLWLGLGVGLQALVGAWLVRPVFRQLSLGRERVLLRALLLGGPVACTIAPTMGLVLSYWQGPVPLETLGADWLLWWVANSIGIVLFTPLLLLLSPRMRQLWGIRVPYVVAPLLAAAAALMIGSYWFHAQEETAARMRLSEKVDSAYEKMRQQEIAALGVASATGHFISASSMVAPQEFAAFSAAMRTPGLLSLQWLPRGEPGVAKPATTGALEQFPVQYSDPPLSHRSFARIDPRDHDVVMPALLRASGLGEPAASAPVRLERDGSAVVLVFVPVYRLGLESLAATASERRNAFKGFVLAVLDPAVLAVPLVAAARTESLVIRWHDRNIDGSAAPLLVSDVSVDAGVPVVWHNDATFMGRQWQLQALGDTRIWHAGASVPSQLFLLGALFGSILLVLYVLSAMGRHRATERVVAQRTAELQDGRRMLEAEVQRRTQALAASERRMRATFDVAAVGICHVAPDGWLLRVNPKLCAITGYTEQEMLGFDPAGITHPDDQARDRACVASVQSGERTSFDIEKRYLRKDGSIVWVRVTSSVVLDDNDAVSYRVAIVEDISEARAATQMRLASERRYRELFEHNPMPMWTYDSATLAFTDVNLAALSHYGYDRDEFLAMTIRDIRPIHEQQLLDSNMASRTPYQRNSGAFSHRKKDGTLISVEIVSYGMDMDGRPVRLVLANDVTVRKRADALVLAQKNVLERIAAGAPLSETLESLVVMVEHDFPGRICSILKFDQDAGKLHHGAAPNLPQDYVRAIDGMLVGPAAGSCGTAAFRRAPVMVRDIATDPLWATDRELALGHGLRACWSTPIFDAMGGVVGTFAVYGNKPGEPLTAERQLIEALTHIAAIAITKEREKAALRESEARFRAIYETSPIGIVLVADDGRILAANPHQCALTGFSEAELKQQTISDLAQPADLVHAMEHFAGIRNDDRFAIAGERRAVRKDGREYWVSVSGAMVRGDDGGPGYAIRVIQEVTDRVLTDHALRASEERFRGTFELAPLGIAHVGPDGRFLRVNPSMSSISGYTEAELLQLGPRVLTYEDDRELDLEYRKRLFAGDIASYSIEKRYRRKDGALIWTSLTVSAVRDLAGKVVYTFGILEDISRRKQAETELQQQQELNRLLLENLAEGVVACDGDGHLIHFNRTAREWHGTDIRRTPPGEWAAHYNLYEGDGRTPLALDRIPLQRAFNGETLSNAEMSIVRHGMPARQVLASGAPLVDRQGVRRGAVVVMHDVTERQRSLRELECVNELNEATRTQTEPEQIMAVTVNRLGTYLLASRCVYADVAPDGDQLIVARDFARDGPSATGNYRLSNLGAELMRRLRSGQVVALDDIDAQMPEPDGPVLRALGLRATLLIPLLKGDALRALMVVGDTTQRQWSQDEIALARSITERCWTDVERERAQRALADTAGALTLANAAVEHERQMLAERVALRTQELTAANRSLARARDAAEAASRAKSVFLATVSHEIRTPMNGVLGAMELLERAGLDDERGALLGTAQDSARSLLGLLNDLLDMAKIEAGRIAVSLAPASLQAIVGQVVSIHLPNAIGKQIDLAAEIAPGVPDWFQTDALRLRQILGNLVSNAVKFTSHGGVMLEVTAAPGGGGGTHEVRFAVRDSGVGIPPDAMGKLFQPFEQGNADLARQSGGTGLGLAISRGLAERMGGTVNMQSTPGEGTTATLTLTLESVEAPAIEPAQHGEDDAAIVTRYQVDNAGRFGEAQVLVVDDHPVNRRLLARQMEQLGYVADVACDGVEALGKLRSGRYALVITDCEMPRMDGYALVKAIRNGHSGATPDLTVIACTAHALPEVEQRCRSSGMDEVLTKPITLADLARVLDRFRPELSGDAPARVPVDHETVLDAAQLRAIVAGDDAMERELLQEFLADTRSNMAVLQAAVSAGEYLRSKEMAHRSLGACRIVGAMAMGAALRALERLAGEQGSPEQIDAAMAGVWLQHRRLDAMVSARLAGEADR